MRENQSDQVYQLCLQAFMEIFAIISHEMKNSLAIVNENAGLLDDFVLFAGENQGVESIRVQKVTTAIQKQVIRSNQIIKDMNCLAHTADIVEGEVKISETLQLLVDLTSRKAAAAEMTIVVECPHGLRLETAIPVFETILYRMLSIMYQTAQGGVPRMLRLRVGADSTSTTISLIADNFSFVINKEYEQDLETLCRYLNVTLKKETRQLVIIL